MNDRGYGHRLAAQTLARVRVDRQLARQQLDGDLPIEPRIAGAIDLAHAARADPADDFVRADDGPGWKRHGQ